MFKICLKAGAAQLYCFFFSPADAALFVLFYTARYLISDNSSGIRAKKHAESGGGATCNDRSCQDLWKSKLLFQEAGKIWYNKLLNYACTSVKTQP